MMSETIAQKAGIRNAATVMLIREQHTPPFEIFLMRRHRKQSFMGGAFVFPGGAQDAHDSTLDMGGVDQNPVMKQSLKRLTESGISRSVALGLFVTAIRETFEEAGVLFAVPNATAPTQGGVDPARWTPFRTQLHSGERTLAALAAAEHLVLAPERLIPYARWVTPEIENKRFDTIFFLAKMPPGQTPAHDNMELVESMWISPKEALKQNREKKILLMPPTLKTLEELTAFGSADQLFEAAAQRKITPILPQAITSEIRFGIKLPHDPEYSIAGYKQEVRPHEPSRIMMKDGIWTTEFAKNR